MVPNYLKGRKDVYKVKKRQILGSLPRILQINVLFWYKMLLFAIYFLHVQNREVGTLEQALN